MSQRFESKPLVLGVVAFCFVYGWLNFDMFLSNRHVLSLLYSALGLAGGIGLLFRRPWSRFFVYIIAALAIAVWLFQWIQAIASGVSYDTKMIAFFSIVLTMVPPGLALVCSYVVHKRFRKPSPAV